MKLKVAVVAGPENVGKSYTLKSFARSIYECYGDRITDVSVRPVVFGDGGNLSEVGFQSENGTITDKETFRKTDRRTQVKLDWDVVISSNKDILMSGICNGKKFLIATEGDYLGSWLVNITELQNVFGSGWLDEEIILIYAWKTSQSVCPREELLALRDRECGEDFKVLDFSNEPKEKLSRDEVSRKIRKQLTDFFTEATGC